MASTNKHLNSWTFIAPALGWLLIFAGAFAENTWYLIAASIALMATVTAAIHFAEVIAHKVGEPFGTLILAVAITVIEVSIIVSLMLQGGKEAGTVARDTVFAAVMIIITGIIGGCLLLGGAKFREQSYLRPGVSTSLVTLSAIAVTTLMLPNYTTSIKGPFYTTSQLIFVAAISLILYLSFVFVQSVRHREYFTSEKDLIAENGAAKPSNTTTWISLVMLLLSLGAVVLLAKALSPFIEKTVADAGAPKAVVGIIVAMIILLPEGIAALKAARQNKLQTSLNLALGSALASIGLSIPTVAIVSAITGLEVTLGIDEKSGLLMVLALFCTALSFANAKTTIMQGIVLLTLFAVYLFLTIVP